MISIRSNTAKSRLWNVFRLFDLRKVNCSVASCYLDIFVDLGRFGVIDGLRRNKVFLSRVIRAHKFRASSLLCN